MDKLISALLAFIMLAGAPLDSSAQSIAWNSPIDLSATGQDAVTPQIALSSDGTRATAVWTRSNGTNNIIQAASATISGNTVTWSSVTDLSATGQNASGPQIALSSDGTRATAVWSRSNGTNNIIQAASATISGNTATWSSVTDLSATGQNAFLAEIALSSDGTRATAVWYRSNGANDIVQSASATISGNTATWSSVTDLSAAGQEGDAPQIALSSDGTRATAVWFVLNGANFIIQSASATISGNTATWSSVTDLSATGQSAFQAEIALSSDGTRATAVWYRSNGTKNIIQAASATISGNTATWSSVTDLSATGQDGSLPQIALSSDGTRATAVWYRSNGTHNIIQAASATISGNTATWSSVTDLSATGQNGNAPQIALSSDGTRATAVWYRFNGANNIVQSASATISGNTATWSSVTDLSATGQNAILPEIALSSDGTQATAVWFRSNGTNNIVQAASGGIPPTPTPTSTPTATATNTPTATSTPTDTPQSTPTAAATNSPAITPVPPTSTPINTPQATSTITPEPPLATATPTATGTVPAGGLSGMIVDPNGQGIPNVTVYAYSTGQGSDRSLGVSSTITDDVGNYTFLSLLPGSYRIEPDLPSFAFQTIEVSIDQGVAAPPIVGVPVELNDDGCDSENRSGLVVLADNHAESLKRLALELADEFTKRGAKRLSRPEARSLASSLDSAEQRLNRTFARVIALSAQLPKITLECGGKSGCASRSMRRTVARYRLQLNGLRRLAFFVLRRSREALGPEASGDTLDRTIRKLHATAVDAARSLPRRTDVCR